MRAFLTFLLMTFAVGLLADETITNRVTPEFLTSRGFVQSKSDTNIFTLERVTVREAAKRLGFSPDQMRHTPSQPLHSDVRIVKVLNLWFVVSSEVRDSQDRVVSGSLDKPDAICTVSVGLTQAPDTRKMTPKGKRPNHTLQRTGSAVTAPATFHHHLSTHRQVPRPLRLSLSLSR